MVIHCLDASIFGQNNIFCRKKTAHFLNQFCKVSPQCFALAQWQCWRVGDSGPPLTGFVCSLLNRNSASFICFTVSNKDVNKGRIISAASRRSFLSVAQRGRGTTPFSADIHQERSISLDLLTDGGASSYTNYSTVTGGGSALLRKKNLKKIKNKVPGLPEGLNSKRRLHINKSTAVTAS